MSFVNEHGEQIRPVPPQSKCSTQRRIKSAITRRRYRRWLATQRRLGMSGSELAVLLNRPVRTVTAGLLWAVEDELKRARWAGDDRSRVVDPHSGLTENEVFYLLNEYPPDTELGSHPLFWETLGPLLDKILGPPVVAAELGTVQAA